MRLPIALLLWAAAVVGAVAVSSTVAHKVHAEQVKAAKTTDATSASKPRPGFSASSVRAADRRSLFLGPNFARALKLVRDHVGPNADVEMIEVFPGELEMTVRRSDAELSIVAQANGDYLSTSDNNVSGSTQVFSLSQIHGNVPATLVRRVTKYGHIGIGQIRFVNVRIDPIARLFHWYVYPIRDDLYFRADSAEGPIQQFSHGLPGRVIRAR